MKVLDILVLLDRSGSMQDAKSDHEGGLKSFVADQQALPGDVRFTLIQFDTANPCEVIYDRVPLDAVGKIELVPRGGTPLLDAMGRALDHLTKHAPDEVICMVITDGEENESREWTKARVAARVKELEEKHRWTFLFLGANIDAFAEAASLGVGSLKTLGYSHAPGVVGQSVNSAYRSLAANTGTYRGMRAAGMSASIASNAMDFSDDQRIASSGLGPDDPLPTFSADDPTTYTTPSVADTPDPDKDDV